ncbi:uncharacterized protein F4822DRAFT_232341 [Hypoxylon trugodes]|uniref:uncharacterized protein n=1 Tax=Hypoxylon trugodes TaxID=326681 RepID=UPI00219426EF|nr:uncharacterized protein F4822DRAFT_232341 [Hypoxylon trugodes]KAI1390312.1 hypothetical protein F4822DRAFT_232341 [Hypoxylon trugodes]
MKRGKILRKVLALLEGFDFESVIQPWNAEEGHILMFFIESNLSATMAMSVIMAPIERLFLTCIQHEDLFRRLCGAKDFYYTIMADWNVEHRDAPFSPASIEKAIVLFINARRQYMGKNPSSQVANAVTTCVDHFAAIIDNVGTTMLFDHVSGLRAPSGHETNDTWPPAHFGPIDLSILGESTIHNQLFGVNHENKLNAPRYLSNQDTPTDARMYLSWLALTELKPSNPATSLFMAPVAFVSDKHRREWYKPTGHNSRYYATVDEFCVWARNEFKVKKDGERVRQHVMGLLTPWFVDVDEVTTEAQNRDVLALVVWQNGCLRAGMVVCLTKLKYLGVHISCRITLFKPGPPHYEQPAEPSERAAKQNSWEEAILKRVKSDFMITEGWTGGQTQDYNAMPTSHDAVEASSKFVTEVMRDPETLPTTPKKCFERGFESMDNTIFRYLVHVPRPVASGGDDAMDIDTPAMGGTLMLPYRPKPGN